MEEKYLVFKKGFNKVLDLLSGYDMPMLKKYKRVIDIMPENVIDAVSCCDDFATDNKQFNVDFMRHENAVSLDYSRNQNYLRAEIYVHRFFEEDLFNQNLYLKIFSLNIRNSQVKKPTIQLYYEVNGNKLNFVGTNDKDNKNNIELTYEVYLINRDNEYYLVFKNYFRGAEISEQEFNVSFDELYQYVENEDKYEEDFEVEFDADFDL